MKVSIIGGGTVGSSLASMLIKEKVLQPEHLTIVERNEATCDELRRTFGCYVSTAFYPAICEVDVIILAVKPQDFNEVSTALSLIFKPGPLILSVMTGIRVEKFQKKLPAARVVRCMPNLPLIVEAGAHVCYFPPGISTADIDRVERILAPTGSVISVASEDLIDAATAVSASGPGFLAHIIEAYIQAATAVGFERTEATELVYQTIHGTIELLRKGDFTTETLQKRVATKNGTTEAALKVLEEREVKRALIDAVKAALVRAQELQKS